MAESDLHETPLRTAHEKLGARMVPFAGWRMPVQYTGIVAEHTAVRENVGVFDISHMGQFFVSGPSASAWLNGLLTNDVNALGDGEGQYSLLLNENGGVIDDLILYRLNAERFFLVVNASMIEADAAWMREHLPGDGVTSEDRSASFAGMAVQGPASSKLAEEIFKDASLEALPPRNGIARFGDEAEKCYVCRTGYTGEDGFEFFCPAESGIEWLQSILDAGAEPCGLGARDTLRLEMGYPLNGSDLSPDRTPLEAGLGFFVKLDKGEFIGRETLLQQKTDGLPSRLYALKVISKGPPPRAHYPVLLGDEALGETCSGGVSPSTGAGIALAYLLPGKVKIGDQVDIEIRGRRFPAEIVKKPFYKRAD
ncbi:MAG: glycine cleavage system aminomethyltransferase GcvT [Verrucomicrobiae bacterium]|nr:glycine cleavage system aminomethyltransferase GcvT [Verrucomicrobiae bacterium]